MRFFWNILYSKGYRTELKEKEREKGSRGRNIERNSLRMMEDDRRMKGINRGKRRRK